MLFWRLLSAVLVIYILLICIRMLLSWFPGAAYGRPWQLLSRATDPYLAVFRGLSFLRRGMFDFTAIAAILVLVVALDLVTAIQRYGRLTAGILLGSLVGALWSGLSFLVLLFLVLAVLRALLLLFLRGRESPYSGLLATMVAPVLSLVRGLLPRDWAVREPPALYFTIAALVALRLVGGWLIQLLRGLLYALPF